MKEKRYAVDVPYQRQHQPNFCGAAALCMVYQFLGQVCTQAEVQAEIVSSVGGRSQRARTRLMARHALKKGFGAVILRAREPWPLLQRCAVSGVPLILNHRLSAEDASGHYSVLLDANDHHIVLHDPLLGSGRILQREEFLRLWAPSCSNRRRAPGMEVPGYVLILMSAEGSHAGQPSESGRPIPSCPCGAGFVPDNHRCRWCQGELIFRPAIFLGCFACSFRLWLNGYCPGCDQEFFAIPFAHARKV